MAKVMVVDDEDELVDMIGMVVEDLGHEVMTATNGKEAIRALAGVGAPPALIISDVMMPQMNGVDLVRALKADPRLSHVPVILMSAAGPPAEYDTADYFIHKPFDLDALVELIEQCIADPR
ncbi:MAG TPA: response regulator [Herpetosiphonaceae bacterium]